MATSFISWITSVADRGRDLLDFLPDQSPPATSVSHLRTLCAELLSRKGEATGVALAREVVARWNDLAPGQRRAFFEALVEEYSVDKDGLDAALKAYQEAPSETTLIALNRATEPKRQELLRRINMAPGGTRAIVKMREALIQQLDGAPRLAALDADMQHLLGSWFNRGFLELRRIDWDSPASVLEKLIQYEAVHEINGWEDLHRRLAADRRCFAFFHPAVAGEPLIFVEVALTRGLVGNVQDLLAAPMDGAPTEAPDTAIFYSISNCQDGLRGVSFGNFLIKQVVEELRQELPRIQNFATLSPIPGFIGWLKKVAAGDDGNASALAASVARLLKENWHQKKEAAAAAQTPLLHLCAYYLVKGRDNGVPLDPVARFHLRNGAQVEQLNWLGDVSRKGLAQSAGITVNYAYRTDRIERNHEAFVDKGYVAASRPVRGLAVLPRRIDKGLTPEA